MIRSYTMMKTGSTTGTVCHQGKRIKPDHGPTPEDHDPRKLPLGRRRGWASGREGKRGPRPFPMLSTFQRKEGRAMDPVEIAVRRVGKECRSRWSPYH